MKSRDFIMILAGPWLLSFAAFGEVSSKRPVVAVLVGGSATNAVFVNSFRKGMRELRYVDARDIDVVYRYADGDLTRLPTLVSELMAYNPAVFCDWPPGREVPIALDLGLDGAEARIHALPDHAAEKAPVAWKSSLPVGVVVSRCCWSK